MTRGPWIFEPHNGYGSNDPDGDHFPFGYISQRPGRPIFELKTVLDFPIDELFADAILAAAAPNLMTALIEIAGYPKHGEPEESGSPHNQNWYRPSDPNAVVDALHAIIDLARAAVSAAKGERS